MVDERLSKLAKVLVNYSLSIKDGDSFLIQGHEITIPLIKEVYKEALLKGANPDVRIIVEELQEMLFKYGNDKQIKYVSPVIQCSSEKYNATLRIGGSFHSKPLISIDPAKLGSYEASRRKAGASEQRRTLEGNLRWSITHFPTIAGAMEANMSLSEYEDFVFSACFADKKDPIAEWKKLKEDQQRIVDFLMKKDHIRIVALDTDLSLRVGGRTWINSCGTTNLPSGEVFTGPVEDSLNGHIRYTYPAIKSGTQVEDVRLTFENGRVVKAEAKQGEEFLNTMIGMDSGSCYAGEFAFGTNYGINRFTNNMLYDEKIGGTIHIALGAAYPSTGSKNESGLHWDMLCNMREGGEVYADGELVYKNGKFIF
ncbi:MAG: peptidase M29 [Clostridia bacterium BRH_c25]|nr:MAG: peptidase M29 [Clostridia bacterium BRH_c25]